MDFFLKLTTASQAQDPTIGHTHSSPTSSPPQRAQAPQDRTPEGAKGRVRVRMTSMSSRSLSSLSPTFSPSLPPFPFSPYRPFPSHPITNTPLPTASSSPNAYLRKRPRPQLSRRRTTKLLPPPPPLPKSFRVLLGRELVYGLCRVAFVLRI